MKIRADSCTIVVSLHNTSAFSLALFCVITIIGLGALILIGGCNNSSNNIPNRIMHPTSENIPDPDTLAHFIREVDTFSTDPEMEKLAERLRAAAPMDTIGVLEGPRHYMFGEIVDAKINSKGELFVLDGEHRELFVYTSTGDYITTIGRPGDGPGEFAYPQDMHIDDNDDIYVADRRNTISVFRPTSATYTLATTISLGFSPESICVTDNTVLVAGPWIEQDSNPIHALDIGNNYKYVDSFGISYRDDIIWIRLSLSVGLLSCRANSSITYAQQRFSSITGFGPSRFEYMWTSALADFTPATIETVTDDRGLPGLMYGGPHERSHFTIGNVHFDSTSHLIVQLGERIPTREVGDGFRISTYLVNGRSGMGVYIGDDLPLVLDQHSNIIVVTRQAGFPHLILMQF